MAPTAPHPTRTGFRLIENHAHTALAVKCIRERREREDSFRIERAA